MHCFGSILGLRRTNTNANNIKIKNYIVAISCMLLYNTSYFTRWQANLETIRIQIYMQFSVQLVTVQCTLCTARKKKNIYIYSLQVLYIQYSSYQQVKPYHAQHCLFGCLISCLSLYNQFRYLQFQQIFYTFLKKKLDAS